MSTEVKPDGTVVHHLTAKPMVLSPKTSKDTKAVNPVLNKKIEEAVSKVLNK